jgi:hypothetical protein
VTGDGALTAGNHAMTDVTHRDTKNTEVTQRSFDQVFDQTGTPKTVCVRVFSVSLWVTSVIEDGQREA